MLAVAGYGMSVVGYAFLLLLILTVRKSGLAKYLLGFATAATCLWSAVPFFISPLSLGQLLLFDNIKNIFWLLFLASCLKDNFKNIQQVLSRKETWLIIGLPLAGIALSVAGLTQQSWLFLIQTTIALEFLVLLEVIYRQAGDNQWALKPLILYLTVTSIFDFFIFANALMIDQIPAYYLSARAYIYAALIPFLVLAIRRVKTWAVEIYISREVVLHSTLLLAAGGYLFFMAMVGYVVKFLGGEWDSTIQFVLIFLSFTLLITVFSSKQFRSRVKVFITKHFFANQFDYRHEWLKLTYSLENVDDEINDVYQTALVGFLQAIDYQSGCLFRYQHEEISKLADIDHAELNPEELEVIETLCDFFKEKAWIVDFAEIRSKPYNYDGLKIDIAILNRARFQIIIPLYKDNSLWGMAALLGSPDTSKHLNWELRDYINAVTAQISNFLFHQQAANELAENAQFAAFSRMSAFVLHDLKNVSAQIDLILCNAEQHKNNPEFIEDTFETLKHTKARMDKMLNQLTDKNVNEVSSESLVLLSQFIQHTIDKRCANLRPLPIMTVHNETSVTLDKDKFSNVMYHLISNAQQATKDDGKIQILVEKSENNKFMLVKIIDNGVGMSEAFIQTRLFKPFDTTKGNAGMGIGAFDAKLYMDKIGGQLIVSSQENVGSIFTLRIPV